MKNETFVRRLITFTETVLTFEKRRQFRKKEKQKKKHWIRDWIESFLWAAMVVLLINQYLVQAYQVPTESMVSTILAEDRLFVNKLVYGPELIPGRLKINGFARPQRADVMIFQSPEYDSKGPVFDVMQRIIYMLTLSAVDINKGAAQFLIKRLVCVDGDTVKFRQGNLYIKPRGESDFIPEEDFKTLSDLEYGNSRLIHPDYYPDIKNISIAVILDNEYQLPLSDDLAESYEKYTSGKINPLIDRKEFEYWIYNTSFSIEASNSIYSQNFYQAEMGQYVPLGWGMPLGDNRDNSNDGRYFGPISKDKILGRAMFIYWKPYRIGAIR